MDDIRYKNLYDALISHLQYAWHIQSFGKEKINCNNINFDLLQVIYGGFALTQIIEDYFKKVDDHFECTLIPEKLKKIVELIAIDNGKGYTLGDLMYGDEYAVLEKVRNKLAHGDFNIRDGEIIFEESKAEGRINVEAFLNFLTTIEFEAARYTLNSPYTKIFNKVVKDFDKKQIKTEEDFDIICNNLYKIEIKDVPLNSRNRDLEYIEYRDAFYQELEASIEQMDLIELKKYIKKMKHQLKNYGIKITYNIKNIKELDYYQNIKNKYMKMSDYYQTLAFPFQVNRINNISYNLSDGRYQKLDLRRGMQINRWIMDEFKNNPDYTLETLFRKNEVIKKLSLYHPESTIISTCLVGFSAIYEYGLEKGLTQLGNYNLVSIFDGKFLDFSKLEIEKLDTPDMLIEHTFDKYLTDVDNFEEKEIEKAKNLIDRLKNKLENYKKSKNAEESKIKKFENEIEEAENLKLGLEAKIKELKEFSSTFDLEKYTRNINIITHIRHAIAHGNVFVDSYATDINETDIIFKDYIGDKIVYEKKIKVKDFRELFKIKNIDYIHNFLVNNMNSDSLTQTKQSLEENLNNEEKTQLIKKY